MTSVRTCKCITRYGEKCKNRIRDDEKYCHVHKNCGDQKSPRILQSRTVYPTYKFRKTKDVSELFDELKLSDTDDSLKLFSGGFRGIENIIADQMYNYYLFETVWTDGDDNYITRNFIVTIPEGFIHDYFTEAQNPDFQFSSFIESLIYERFPDDEFGSSYSTKYQKVSYKEAQQAENVEDFIVLDISDLSAEFSFESNQTGAGGAGDIKMSLSNNIPTQEEEKLLKRVINSIITKDYRVYNSLVERLPPKLVHRILPYIDVKNQRLVMPLFNWRDPIIFNYNPIHRIATNKFIVQVLIQSIKDNNINLCATILSRVQKDIYSRNKLLLDYCIDFAKQINSTTIDILEDYREQLEL
jgi:hypothetical protein